MTRAENLTDEQIVAYVTDTYGPVMAAKVAEMFDVDPDHNTAFVQSVRASVIREMSKQGAAAE